jgi:hypothetical protein
MKFLHSQLPIGTYHTNLAIWKIFFPKSMPFYSMKNPLMYRSKLCLFFQVKKICQNSPIKLLKITQFHYAKNLTIGTI